MNLIAAVDENYAIGIDGKLIFSIPDDMKQFREKTKGKIVVMGRKTLESFSGGRPLKNRVNIVLSSTLKEMEGAIIVKDYPQLFFELLNYDPKDVFIIGGESIYKELYPYCKKAFITKVFKKEKADTYFPNLDNDENWVIIDESPIFSYNDLEFRYVLYENKDVKCFSKPV